MALTKCDECGKEISTKAEKCPHCGAKVEHTSGCAFVALGLLLIGALSALFGTFTTKSPTPPVAVTPQPAPAPAPTEPPKPPTTKEIAKAKSDKVAREAAEKKVKAMTDNNFCVEVGKNIRAKEQ